MGLGPRLRQSELCSQLNLKHEKPIFSSHFLEKTPEYSGVFFSIFVTNIGFCQNQNHKKKSLEFLGLGPRLRQSNFFQLNLKHEKPIFSSHFLEKTPEYSGVFFRIFVTNIGFCQNQNLKKKLRIFD